MDATPLYTLFDAPTHSVTIFCRFTSKNFFYLRFIILNRNQIDANLRRRKLERSEQNEAEVSGPKLQFTES